MKSPGQHRQKEAQATPRALPTRADGRIGGRVRC